MIIGKNDFESYQMTATLLHRIIRGISQYLYKSIAIMSLNWNIFIFISFCRRTRAI